MCAFYNSWGKASTENNLLPHVSPTYATKEYTALLV